MPPAEGSMVVEVVWSSYHGIISMSFDLRLAFQVFFSSWRSREDGAQAPELHRLALHRRISLCK